MCVRALNVFVCFLVCLFCMDVRVGAPHSRDVTVCVCVSEYPVALYCNMRISSSWRYISLDPPKEPSGFVKYWGELRVLLTRARATHSGLRSGLFGVG